MIYFISAICIYMLIGAACWPVIAYGKKNDVFDNVIIRSFSAFISLLFFWPIVIYGAITEK